MAEKELTAEEKRIQELQDKYSLSDENLKKFFAEEIVPKFARGKKPSENPKLVYLSGQPGAGKSSLSKQYAEEMGGKDAVVVFGADDLRAMLPYAKEVQEKYEMDYPFITKRDSGKLRTMLMDYCFENGYNMVVESIFANPNDDKMPVFEQAKKAGFKMGVAFLGVDENLSSLGIYKRYNDQKNLTGRGFAPTLDMHDKAYALMPQIIAGMTQNPNIDWVRVYDRSGECHGEWYKKAELQECTSILKQSREASFEKDDYAKSMDNYQKVIDDMTLREEAQTIIDTVRQLRKRHMRKKAELDKSRVAPEDKKILDAMKEKSLKELEEKLNEDLRKKAIELAQRAGMPIDKNAKIDDETVHRILEKFDKKFGYKPGQNTEKKENDGKNEPDKKWRNSRDNAKKTVHDQKPNTSGFPKRNPIFHRDRGGR